MRSFRHLTRSEVTEIVGAFAAGETQASLAKRFNVDHSTIHYHVQKYERAYPEEGGVYAVIKMQARRTCLHPSARCTLCTLMWDEIARVERDLIRKLERDLADAQSRLRVAGLSVES